MLITENYRQLNETLHNESPSFGTTAILYADNVRETCISLETQDVLDYGCGKAKLAELTPWPIQSYDPCIPKYSERPRPADLLVSIDVLEHIEPELLENVLQDMKGLAKRAVYLTVALNPAKKTLPDGRNAHLIVKEPIWWLNRLCDYFTVRQVTVSDEQMLFIGEV